MPTTYDPTKDRYKDAGTTVDSIGRNGNPVTPHDVNDFVSYPKGVCVITAGDLTVLPLFAADDGLHTIKFTAAPVGFIPPYRVRRVLATGTTASVCTIEDN